MKLFLFRVVFTLAVVFSCKSTPKHKDASKLPDLVILSASRSPAAGVLAPGTVCTFTFQVKNSGQADYPDYIIVGRPAGQSAGFMGLKAGETKEATINETLYSRAANYEFIFTVDPPNLVKESDESNNKSQPFRIQTTH